jgi:hypothetical protein
MVGDGGFKQFFIDELAFSMATATAEEDKTAGRQALPCSRVRHTVYLLSSSLFFFVWRMCCWGFVVFAIC